MRESLALFENIISYPWFLEASIILFLNKTDLFHEKITRSDLAKHFPAYKGLFSLQKWLLYSFIVSLLSTSSPSTGPAGDPDSAKQFLLQLFLSVNPDPENKRIFSHFTQATDTENIKRVFQDVREHVLEENLKDYNLMWLTKWPTQFSKLYIRLTSDRKFSAYFIALVGAHTHLFVANCTKHNYVHI